MSQNLIRKVTMKLTKTEKKWWLKNQIKELNKEAKAMVEEAADLQEVLETDGEIPDEHMLSAEQDVMFHRACLLQRRFAMLSRLV